MTGRRKSTLRLLILVNLVICLTFGASRGASAEASENASTSCTIDLIANTNTCDGIGALRFVQPPSGGKTVLALTLDPRTSGFLQVRFDVTYNAEPSGWTVNIGDSATNDGGGGDAATQSNDAELQVFFRQFALIGNDDTTSSRVLQVIEGFAEKEKTVSFTVSNNRTDWRTAAGATGTLSSPFLFALNGQVDREGPINYDIYAAFNRSISDPGRSGSGASRIVITFITPQPLEIGDGKAIIQYTGDRAGDFHDPANLSAVLLDTGKTPAVPIPDAVLTFRLGQQACNAPTDAQGRASCSLTPEAEAGDRSLRVEFPGDFLFAAAQASDTFTVRREQSHLAITSPPAGPGIPEASVRAVLREDGALPIAGRQVLFEADAVSVMATTGTDGTATAKLALSAGDHAVTASFAGDGFYASTSATQTLRVLPPQIAILPQANAAPAGSSQAVTAQILDGGVSFSGERLGFEILSGPNAGTTGICDTAGCTSDSSGKATFRYTGGPVGGRDTVRAWLDLNHNGAFDASEAQATASLHWTVRHPTAILVASPQGGDYHDPVRLSAVLLDTASAPGVPVAGALLSLASEAGNCTARTDPSGKASCFVTPQSAAGSYALAVDFAGDGRHLSAHAEGTVAITREQATLVITSSAALESGGVVVRAVLREDGSLPVGGRSVTFHAGGQTFPATTDTAGVATANLGLTGGEYTLEASFAGDSFYQPADDEISRLLIYQRGQFVIWGGNAPSLTAALPLGAVYTFWGAQWADQVRAGDFSANPSFKGYADDVFPASGTWRSRPADASHPPASVPAYLGVILSTRIQKDGDVERGNIAGIGVLRVVNPAAYNSDPGHPGTGVLLALLPPSPDSVPAGTPPGAPTGVSAVVGDGFAEARWTPPANTGSGPITGYIVTMSPGGLRFAVPAGETSRIIPGLAFGTSYQFTVAAVGRAGTGPASQASSAVTLLSAPSAPQAVSAVAANAAATVTWSPPAANGGSPILGYVVEPLPDGAPVTIVGLGTTATLTGLENGTSYTFVVRARNAVGLGAESAPSAAVLPASAPSAPSDLVASAASREAILYWTAPAADGGSALTGYRIAVSPGGLSLTVPGDRTFARVTGLDDAVPYRFTIVAANAQGDGPVSAPSDEVIPFGPPGAPGGIQGTRGNGTALVRWSAPGSDGGRAVTGYTVTAEPGGLTAAAPAGETSRLITGLANGTAYTLQVTATNLAGAGPASALSGTVIPLTVPDPPTDAQATGGDATATVTWLAPATDGGSPISRYVVVSYPGDKQVVVDGGVLQATVDGLTNGTPYVFTVRAVNAEGRGPESIRSNYVIPVGAPNAPTNVLAVVGGLATARVTWSASSNNGGSSITTYTVTASPGGRAVTAIGTATAAVVNNLTVGTAYTFTVAATNRIGTGPASQPSNSFVAATVPGAPTNVIAVEEVGGVRVTWTPPASDGFTPIRLYQIFINPFGSDTAKLVGGTTTSLSIGGFPLGVPLSFVVQAINDVGAGPGSVVSNSVTLAKPPGAPGNVTAAADGNAGARVTWTAAASNGAPITNYTVISTPGSLTATVDGTATSATVSGLTVGTTYTFTVTATNRKGAGPASAPSNPVAITGTPPKAEILTPTDGTEITSPTQIVGTATATGFRDYVLEIAPAGESTFTTIARGTAPVAGGVLGTLDPTLLLNDLYTVRLTVFATSGASANTSTSYAVGGGMKVGNFTLSFEDLTVPLSGLPITVVRNYDSRDKRSGDFGYGWTLALRQGSYRNNRKPGLGWEIESGFLPCQRVQELASHATVIRLSDQEIYRFRLNLGSPAPTIGGCFADARFDFVDGPVPGATLTILGDTQVFYQNDTSEVVDTDTFDVFEPRQVRLTTRDGRIFDLELQKGVTRLQDLNGNTLLIGSSGITHSSGRSISFARDGAGRITSITDPMGKSFTYTYDAAGDLIAVTDRSDQTTTFIYDGNHRVLTIEDPRGIQPIRNEYDADGRLIRQIDAFGKAIEYDHELAANQEIVTDRLGHSRLMEYDDRGNVVREVDSLGNETQRTFDDRDNMISVTDPLDATTTYTYDANDNQTSVTDALGHRTTLTFDALGHARTVIGPRGDVNLHDFDDNGNLLSLSNPLGHRIDYQYDEQGEISAETDPVGGITVYEHDTFGNVTRETDPAGHATRYTYDANGNQLAKSTTRTTASGAETLTWVYGYDALGRLVSTTDPDGTSSLQIYDALDHVAERIDKLGRHTTFTYDEMGRLVSTGYADGTSEQSVFDAEGRQTSSTDRGGRTTRFEYDALGRLIRTVYPDDTAETKDYDAAGRLVTLTDARGNATRFEYDRVGRRTKVIDALGHETSFAYDESGNRVAMTDALGRTTRYVYDLANREVQVLFPDGTSRETAYDEAGHKISEIDQARKITRYEYDPLGRLVKVTDALGQTTRYTYDELGDLTRQTDANNHTTELEYDALRRLVRRTLPLGTAETIAYDAAGNPIRRTDFNGATTTYTYDEGNRLTSRTYPDGSSVSFTYNAVGRRTEVIDSRGTTRYEYDVRDRMTRLIDPADRSLEFVYDESGNRASLNAQIGATTWSTASSYDSLNRLAAVTDPQGLTYRIAYDELGNRAEVNYPNGLTTTYRYDIRNHLTDVETRSGSGALLQSFHYTLGPAGNRLRVDEQDGAARLYAYDGLYRLIRETVSGAASYQEEFTYDAVGNRLSQVKTVASGATTTLLYSYDERDRMLSAAGTTYSWDQNGQMQTRSGTDGATYTWSFDGRLTQVLEANGRVTTYAYDADGNRVRTEITPANGPPNVTEYLVDPSGALSQVVAEIDGSRNLTAYYVRGDDLLAVLRPGSIRFFHADGLGSIRALSDESGVLTDTYSFSAFGELLSHVGADVNTYLFAGEPLDPNSGFYHLRARWMDPAAGRFASSDPMEGTLSEPASLHRYLYAFLDPTDRTDPSGLYSIFTYLGTAVHNHIIDEFRGQGPGRTGDEPISTVLRFYRSLPCTGIGCAREPDLVHVGKRSIYEIKPATRGHFIAGFLQIVDLYLPTLHRNDPSGGWWIGDNSSYEPPPPFTLWSQGYLWVIFVAPPIEGVVLYSEVNLTDPRIIRNVRAASKRAIDSFIKRYLQIKQQGEEAQLKANNEQIALSAQLKF